MHLFVWSAGESEYNRQGLIGGDSSLSARGEEYAAKLPDVLESRLPAVSALVECSRKGSYQCVALGGCLGQWWAGASGICGQAARRAGVAPARCECCR